MSTTSNADVHIKMEAEEITAGTPPTLSQVQCTVEDLMLRYYKGGAAAESDSEYKKALEKNLDSYSSHKVKLESALKEAEIKKRKAKLQCEEAEIEAELELCVSRRNAQLAEVEYRVVCEESSDKLSSISARGSRFFKSCQAVRGRSEQVPEFDLNPSLEQAMPVIQPLRSQPSDAKANPVSNSCCGELSRFLLKKELSLARFSPFDDRPESYVPWKTTFQQTIQDLHVTSLEEVDLLLRWLGPESSKFAQSIRTSNIHDPSKCIKLIWKRLEDRYGSPEIIEASIKKKLEKFPKVTFRDPKKLYDLHDLLCEVQSLKENPLYEKLFGHFDTSAGINPVISKLPPSVQGKWRDKASNYKKTQDFISDVAQIHNDPGFNFEPEVRSHTDKTSKLDKFKVTTKKTVVPDEEALKCIIHGTNHSLHECKSFKSKSLEERKKLLKENRICFKCCISKNHLSRDCPEDITCKDCGSKYHCTAMHLKKFQSVPETSTKAHGREKPEQSVVKESVREQALDVTNKSTGVCEEFPGKSCAKILPVYVFHESNPRKRMKSYVILDDQSNKSLAKGELLDFFDVRSVAEEYIITSCSGRSVMTGRKAGGLCIQAVDGSLQMSLPTVIECDELPNNRTEIPTPNIARLHPHLKDIGSEISPLDDQAQIQLLIGRDLPEAHHVLDQVTGPPGTPFAQKMKLGWVIVGEVCLGKHHATKNVNCFTEPGKSTEDKMFLKLMEKEFVKEPAGNWSAPLPFKPLKKRLPNNKSMAVRRANSLAKSLQFNSVKREHFLDFMKKLFERGHAEIAPPLKENEECWYLPVFGVYHPKKPSRIRCVFDSAAKFRGTSLNDVLMTGPDLNNSLLGVLLRFRKNRVAVLADIEMMFYSFEVHKEHRNYLRFLWHKDNDLSKELIEYRMTRHVFGNSPSPAVAIYGLQKTAEAAGSTYGEDVTKFVQRHFYVDDGLISLSNQEVMSALPGDDISQDLKDMDFDAEHLPLQRSLGLYWDLQADIFTYRIAEENPSLVEVCCQQSTAFMIL
nr:uncharacterized protein LOC113824143 [Penaeus vannamei]